MDTGVHGEGLSDAAACVLPLFLVCGRRRTISKGRPRRRIDREEGRAIRAKLALDGMTTDGDGDEGGVRVRVGSAVLPRVPT